MHGAQRHRLSATRWHFQHGPMDVVLDADGLPAAVAASNEAAWQRFMPLLAELVAELPLLRQPVVADGRTCPLQGRVARRMWQACAPFSAGFITPMAAVAGAVAQELLASYQRAGVRRAWVNNGGDIAIHLQPGESTRIGVWSDLSRLGSALDQLQVDGHLLPDGRLTVNADDGVAGIATSGWRGRSHSLGIADSVTVLAATAAQADAAATVIANAVNLDHPCIERRPACELRDDSDLGARLVTVGVPPLSATLRSQALRAGLEAARQIQSQGLIHSAALVCQGELVALRALPAMAAAA